MLAKTIANELLYRIRINSIERMTIKAENLLNPAHCRLSEEAKKRLRWIYVLYYEREGNVTWAANKINISRQWLSVLKSKLRDRGTIPAALSQNPEHRVIPVVVIG